MANSIGGALMEGKPVIFTFKKPAKNERLPQVVCEPGKEAEALEMLAKMGLIELMRPHNGRQPEGTLQPFGEKRC